MLCVFQAHARLCGRCEVGRQDAVVAVAVVDASQGALHSLPQVSGWGMEGGQVKHSVPCTAQGMGMLPGK
jgi:hypothetical protein